MPSRRDREYVRNRRVVLEGGPLCYWCENVKADTVDHVVEMDRFDDPVAAHALTNLVPACRRCNSSRGAQYGNRKRTAVRRARDAAVEASEAARDARAPARFLERPTPVPEPLGKNLSPQARKRPRKAQSGPEEAPAAGSVRIPPRLITRSWGGRTLGGEVAAWASEHLSVELRDWQRLVLDGMLEVDDDDQLRHKWSLTSCARQNGKTVILASLVGWWLDAGRRWRGEPQSVLSVAHRLDLAEELWHVLMPPFDAGRFGECRTWSTHGRKELRLDDGTRWRISSATPLAGHGTTNDLLVVDELWSVDSDVLHAGLLPTQRARRSPLCAMFSTAGHAGSSAMLRWRETGLEQIGTREPGRMHLAEWSPPPGADPTDPATWPLANPSWGHGSVDEQGLRDELQSPNREAFLRSSLNLWTSADGAWIPPGSWDPLTAEITAPPTVLAVEVSRDGSRFVGVLAGPADDDVVEIDTAFVVFSEREMWDRVVELAPRGGTVAIPGSLEIHRPPSLADRSTIVGHGEILKWTGLVRAMIVDGRLRHSGDLALAEHVTRAVGYQTQVASGISSDRSPGPIELCRCLIWAAALASRPTRKAAPAIGGTRRRR